MKIMANSISTRLGGTGTLRPVSPALKKEAE